MAAMIEFTEDKHGQSKQKRASSSELTDLGNEILFFREAMTRASLASAGSDKLFSEEEYAWENLTWCWDMKPKNAENLCDFFLRMDTAIRVDLEDDTNTIIRQGAREIMEALGSKIEQLNGRLKGRLEPMGSGHNGTKINKLDEFDFTYELDITRVLMGQGRLRGFRTKQGRVRILLDVDNQDENLNLFEFPDDTLLETVLSINGSKEYSLYGKIISREENEYFLNTEHVAFGFYSVLQRALSQLDLPEGWYHGGVNRPLFSGVRFNLPAFMIQLDYLGIKNQKPVQLSIDFAPVLRIPVVSNYNKDVVNEHLIKGGYVKMSWLRLEASLTKIAFYSHAEEMWLAEYAADSTCKALMRICKGLCQLAKLSTPKFVPQCFENQIAERLKEIRKGKTEDVSLTRAFETIRSINLPNPHTDSELATYEDIGEVGGHEFLSSYMFKRAVMTLMVLDKENGRTWRTDDLPDLVFSVYMIINDILMSENQSFEILTNEQISEDSMSKTFDMDARFNVMSEGGLYDQMKSPSLLKWFSIPLNVWDGHQKNNKELHEDNDKKHSQYTCMTNKNCDKKHSLDGHMINENCDQNHSEGAHMTNKNCDQNHSQDAHVTNNDYDKNPLRGANMTNNDCDKNPLQGANMTNDDCDNNHSEGANMTNENCDEFCFQGAYMTNDDSDKNQSESVHVTKENFDKKHSQGSQNNDSSTSTQNDLFRRTEPMSPCGWSKAKPPMYFTMLKSAMKQGKCKHLLSLFSREKFTYEALSIGLDPRIDQVFQLLQCISEGRKSAEISVWWTPKDISDITDYYLTKKSVKKMLDVV